MKQHKISAIKLIIYVLLYILVIVVQLFIQGHPLSEIIAQAHVILSVLMIVNTTSYAYKVAVITNLLYSVFVFSIYIRTQLIHIIPGIVIPLTTIVLLTLIHFYFKQFILKIKETIQKNEELSIVHKDMMEAKKELAEQNNQLNTYNALMKQNEARLHALAFYDSLTVLPNRQMILDRLDLLFKNHSRNALTFALVFIDLDNFKKINDSLGHAAGDLLLKTAVDRINQVVHEKDLLGRLGGDEFALIVHRPMSEDNLYAYIETIKNELVEPFYIQDSQFNIGASFGISLFPLDGDNTNDMMKAADTAMYKAKEKGRNNIQFYSEDMKEELLQRIAFENQLRAAILSHELTFVFQPQFKSESKQLRGIEILTRWQSPILGNVTPAQFIPVAEETGLIIPLGKRIIREACLKLRALHDVHNCHVVMSVNVTAVQLLEPNFVNFVTRVVSETGCDTQFLEFEITESVFLASKDDVIQILSRLKKLGIRIALDDFGTGYSSLNYLKLLPFDTLKIDKSFIDSINIESSSEPVIGFIINLLHHMDITVVAEGVENEYQLHYLKNERCDYIQGYFWGEPVHEADLILLLDGNQPL